MTDCDNSITRTTSEGLPVVTAVGLWQKNLALLRVSHWSHRHSKLLAHGFRQFGLPASRPLWWSVETGSSVGWGRAVSWLGWRVPGLGGRCVRAADDRLGGYNAVWPLDVDHAVVGRGVSTSGRSGGDHVHPRRSLVIGKQRVVLPLRMTCYVQSCNT